MSTMLSRWPIVLSLPIDASDIDGEGILTEVAIDRLVDTARCAYLDLCTTFDRNDLEFGASTIVRGCAVEPTTVTISIGVVEIYPDELVMEARLRPGVGDGIAASVRCTLGIEVSNEIRDEVIALAHNARDMN